MRKVPIIASLILIILALLACMKNAQELSAQPQPTETPTDAAPTPENTPADPKTGIDGVVKPGEYQRSYNLPPFGLQVSRKEANVRFALTVKTTGWVALGLNSNRMDGALIFIGNVQDGKINLSEQLGKGHMHGDVSADKRLNPGYAIKETDGTTVLELEFAVDKIASKDAKELTVILAYAADDSFRVKHVRRQAATVRLD